MRTDIIIALIKAIVTDVDGVIIGTKEAGIFHIPLPA